MSETPKLTDLEREMLEALRDAATWARANGFADGMMGQAPWFGKAQAAITRAQGWGTPE